MGDPNFRQVTPTTIDISNALPARSQKKAEDFSQDFLLMTGFLSSKNDT